RSTLFPYTTLFRSVRIANGKIAHSIGPRPNRHCDCRPSLDDLFVERVHVLDPEEDANTRRRVLALCQMNRRIIPPDHTILCRVGSRVRLEPEDIPVEVGCRAH